MGFNNRDGVCLLRGTGWVLIYNQVNPSFESVLDKEALRQIFLRVLLFSLSISFHQWSTLVFIHIQSLRGGPTLFRKYVTSGQKITFI